MARALPADLLFLLLERLTGDTEGGYWSSLEPFVRNDLFASFTNPIYLLVHAIKRFVDLLEQLLLAFLDPHREILIWFFRLVSPPPASARIAARWRSRSRRIPAYFPCSPDGDCLRLVVTVLARDLEEPERLEAGRAFIVTPY